MDTTVTYFDGQTVTLTAERMIESIRPFRFGQCSVCGSKSSETIRHRDGVSDMRCDSHAVRSIR